MLLWLPPLGNCSGLYLAVGVTLLFFVKLVLVSFFPILRWKIWANTLQWKNVTKKENVLTQADEKRRILKKKKLNYQHSIIDRECQHECVHCIVEAVNTVVTQHGHRDPTPRKHFWNSGFDVFSQLLHGPSEINISFLSSVADLEEASVKQLILCGNERFSRQTTSYLFSYSSIFFFLFTFKSARPMFLLRIKMTPHKWYSLDLIGICSVF